MTLNKLYKQFTELQSYNGRLDKISYINNNLNDNVFIGTLSLLLNSFVVFGIGKKKLEKGADLSLATDIEDLTSLLTYLSKNNTGSGKDIATVLKFTDSLDDELTEFVHQLVTKTFKVGVTAETINENCKGVMIPTYSVQLAHDYTKHLKFLESYVKSDTFALSEKLDGVRVTALVTPQGTEFYTRQGKKIDGMSDLEYQYNQLFHDTVTDSGGFAVDGEVINTINPKSFSQTQSIVSTKGEKKDLMHKVFDIVPINEFYMGRSNLTYNGRRRMLATMSKLASHKGLHLISVLPLLYTGNDLSVIPHYLSKVEEQGGEGLMINLNDVYITKRTRSLLKVKSFHSADLKVTGVFEGEGKLAGTLGGIIVDYKGYEVKVGTGFDEATRKEFWEDTSKIVGKIAEIKYFEESTNKSDNSLSLRFPVFQCVRFDKSDKDVNID